MASGDAAARLDCLQVLRGVAAAMVVLYHTGTLYAVHAEKLLWGNVFRAGFSGVEVFFVLSGLVIYWVHGADIGRPERVRSFVVRRGFRLLPVYWTVVLLKALKDPAALSVGSLATAMLLLPAYPPFVNVSWSLSYELLFYAAFMLAIALPRGWWTLVPLGLLVLPALLPAPAVSPSSPWADWVRFVFNTHLLGFLFGVAVGWALRRFGPAPAGSAWALVGVGLAVFVATAVWGTLEANRGAAVPGRTAYESAELIGNPVFDAGVWLFGVPTALVLGGLMSLELRARLIIPFGRALGGLGDISYSLYLTHGFVIHLFFGQATFRRLVDAFPPVMLLVWGAALVLAWCFYRAVEVPALRLGRRFATPRVAPQVAAR